MRACEDHLDVVVVYLGNYCPLCEAIDERDEANNKLNSAESDIDDLKAQIASLKDELQDAEIRLASERHNDRRD